jgi:serine protease Do
MNNKRFTFLTFFIVMALVLSACATLPALSARLSRIANPPKVTVNNAHTVAQLEATATLSPTPTQPAAEASGAGSIAPAGSNGGTSSINNAALLEAYQGTLETIYTQVNPSVVNIHVVLGTGATGNSRGLPGQNQANPPVGEALGSGFVWDTEGHIVTNNHVVDGATKIDVTFSDGTNVIAKKVGNDSSSDLAVIQVSAPANLLKPVALADSKQIKVGQIAIAIGNPFGLNGTMTVGIVSALGRSLSAGSGSITGAGYSIPNIIQTDAPINPGNSGGVLVNDQGQVIGVTAAIQSSTDSNAGIGFVIPANTVRLEIPTLIKSGRFDHPFLGISGATLTADLANAMNLKAGTRGALVGDVVTGGPAAQAGLQGSNRQVDINGQPATVGGDVITAINGQAINSMDDLIAYLADFTTVGQKVSINILRNGQEKTVDATLQARPDNPPITSSLPNQGQGDQGQQGPQFPNRARLGISGVDLTTEINQAMKLPDNQQGVLIEQVQPGSAAEKAGLRAGSTNFNLNGQSILIGGDVITALDSRAITGVSDLTGLLAQDTPGQMISLSILRDGKAQQVQVTLDGSTQP